MVIAPLRQGVAGEVGSSAGWQVYLCEAGSVWSLPAGEEG